MSVWRAHNRGLRRTNDLAELRLRIEIGHGSGQAALIDEIGAEEHEGVGRPAYMAVGLPVPAAGHCLRLAVRIRGREALAVYLWDGGVAVRIVDLVRELDALVLDFRVIIRS